MKDRIVTQLPIALRRRLDPTKKYLVAVSGGADSLALADGMLQSGLTFAVCHVEHGIRGEASLADAAFVERFCRERSIPFFRKTVEALSFSKKEGLSLEDAARQLRYRALFQCAEEEKADFILTAHQKDDQAETFLLRLLRGAGTRGLGAIRFQRGNILRPLLQFTGEELRRYCRLRELSWREDATNDDLRYTRNRVRKVLLPLLRREFSAGITDVLCRTAENLQTDASYLDEVAEQELQKRLEQDTAAGARRVLRVQDWSLIPQAFRYRILQLFWQTQGGPSGLSGTNLRQMEKLAERGCSGKRILLPGSWQLLYNYDKLILLPPNQNERSKKNVGAASDRSAAQSVSLALSEIITAADADSSAFTEIRLPQGKTVLLRIVNDIPSYQYRRQAIYPVERLKELGTHLTFRHRLPGDRILPLKGTGHKSLKKFLIDEKIPQAQRDDLLLVAVGNEVLWLSGLYNAGWGKTVPDRSATKWLFMTLV